MAENYVRIDGGLLSLSLIRTKAFCPKVWFGLEPFEKTFTITRNGNCLVARFRSRFANQAVEFYKKLVGAHPDITISYEYFSDSLAAYGHIDKEGPEGPFEHQYVNEQELCGLRALRQWKLPLVRNFIQHVHPFTYDSDGDCIMIMV